jgi:hypothetical protein
LVPMFIGFVGILGVIAWNPTHFNLVKVGNWRSMNIGIDDRKLD